MKRTAQYMRVSTLDQHRETQPYDLRQMAGKRGFEIVNEYTYRISGAKASKRDQKKPLKSRAKPYKTHSRKYSIRPCQKVCVVKHGFGNARTLSRRPSEPRGHLRIVDQLAKCFGRLARVQIGLPLITISSRHLVNLLMISLQQLSIFRWINVCNLGLGIFSAFCLTTAISERKIL